MSAPTPARTEWPTVALAIAIHGGWLAITALARHLPFVPLAAIGGWLIAWHGSLQHELIHGHPTRSRKVNDLLGALPLALWLPYRVYRRSHLAHHGAAAITDPLDDTESRYLVHDDGRIAAIRRMAARAQATLAGRLLLGPVIVIAGFLFAETIRFRHDPVGTARDWLPHLAGCAAILWWLDRCGIGLATYLAAFVYPGTALSLLRSFAEHRAAAEPGHRVAIVESRGPLALLFLNNNLHAAHHARPGLAWYRLPAHYRARRAALLAGNGGLVYPGYGAVIRRFLVRPHDILIHPDHAG